MKTEYFAQIGLDHTNGKFFTSRAQTPSGLMRAAQKALGTTSTRIQVYETGRTGFITYVKWWCQVTLDYELNCIY